MTPVNVNELSRLLTESGFDKHKTQSLIAQFVEGFDMGYRGPMDHRDEADNIPLKVGSQTELWNKMMKEVKAHRVAGPYE